MEGHLRGRTALPVSISPSVCLPRFEHGFPTMLAWALQPADDAMLVTLFERGRSDGETWAQRQIQRSGR